MNKKFNKIFLSGGGGADDSFLVDKAFIQSLTVKKILYIPIALDRDTIGYEACYDWIIESLSQHSNNFVDITMWTDLKKNKLEDITMFDAIYIGGGNTFNLYKKICESNFNQLLPQFVERGGILYGSSAGAIIFGKSLSTAKFADTNLINWTAMEGMNLINNYSIWCHYNYQEEQDNLINQLIFEGVEKIIALSNQTGVVVEGSKLRVIGYKPAIIFKSNSKLNIQPGKYPIFQTLCLWLWDVTFKKYCSLNLIGDILSVV